MKIVTDGIKEVADLMEYFLSGGIRTKSANILKNAGRRDNMAKEVYIYREFTNTNGNYTKGGTDDVAKNILNKEFLYMEEENE